MAVTTFEKGIEQETRKFLITLLEHRFGPLEEPLRDMLNQLSVEEAEELGKQALGAPSLEEWGLKIV